MDPDLKVPLLNWYIRIYGVLNRQRRQIVYVCNLQKLDFISRSVKISDHVAFGSAFLAANVDVDAGQMQLDDLRASQKALKYFNQLATLSLSLALKVQSQ